MIPGVQLASTPALEAVMELDDDKDDEEEGKNEKQQEDKEQENEKNSYNKLDEKSPCKYVVRCLCGLLPREQNSGFLFPRIHIVIFLHFYHYYSQGLISLCAPGHTRVHKSSVV